MNKMKLAVIGGGSVNWMIGLMRDVYLLDEVQGGEICLMDPKLAHAHAVAGMLHRFNTLRKKDYQISVTNDREKALEGADFVMTTFSPGSMDAFWNDLELPIRYGVRLPVSMTVGVSGISAAIRTVPVAYEIVEDMERLCPGAWLLNVTNPMSAVINAMHKAAKTVKVVGMCHEFHAFEQWIGPMLDLPRPQGMSVLDYLYRWLPAQGLDYTVAGINHFIWLTKAALHGEDVLPRVLEYCKRHNGFPKAQSGAAQATTVYDSVGYAKTMLCRQFSCLPLAGDRHLVEFYPSLCNQHNGFGMRYGVQKTTVDFRRSMIKENLARIQRIADGQEEADLSRSGEEMTEIMRAILTGGSTKAIVNAPNAGQIANMPHGAIVETLATVDQNGVRPLDSGALPAAVGVLCRLHADIHELTVQAALSGDRQTLLEAMSIDPSTGGMNFEEIPLLMEDLLNANKAWLPRFFPGAV